MSPGPMIRPELIETLRDAQRLGFFGPAPIESAVEHALGFVVAVTAQWSASELDGPRSIVDLGSGGGLPGLVIAEAMPEVRLVLIDRRQKRTDFLARASRRLAYHQVEVLCADVADLAGAVETGGRPPFDAVTARGFGPPEPTLRLATRLIAASGFVLISEPPAGDRWDPGLLDALDLASERVGSVRIFTRRPT